MTPAEAIRFAVDTLPAIHQDPDGYGLRSVTEYQDLTIYTFWRVRLPAGASQIMVTVRDNRLPNGAPSASYEVV